jgi:superoxide dismutase
MNHIYITTVSIIRMTTNADSKTSHMDYGAKVAAYVDAFMKNINWETVSTLYQSIHAPKAASPPPR